MVGGGVEARREAGAWLLTFICFLPRLLELSRVLFTLVLAGQTCSYFPRGFPSARETPFYICSKFIAITLHGANVTKKRYL